MHSLYALTTAQCCSRDGDRIASYSIANGNQCDVIAHTRGKAGDVIAVPRYIFVACPWPLADLQEMLTLKSTDTKQVLETSHEKEMLVRSVLTVLTVGASGCSVIAIDRN